MIDELGNPSAPLVLITAWTPDENGDDCGPVRSTADTGRTTGLP